jgi:hypothetical protein
MNARVSPGLVTPTTSTDTVTPARTRLVHPDSILW